MSASIWTRLGLKRTRDRVAVRRAYAARLKTTHPEDDPEGFKALRQAYEQALAYADGRVDDEAQAWAPEVSDPAPERATEPEPIPEPEPSTELADHAAACGRLQALLAGPADRDQLEAACEAVLRSPALEAVDVERRTESWLARLLLERAPLSDPVIWPVMQRFGWDRPQTADADPVLRQLAARLDALNVWAASRGGAGRALRRAPNLLTWTHIFGGDVKEIDQRIAAFGAAPPADMHPGALAWWRAYLSRPRPPVGALWIAIMGGIVVAALTGGYLADQNSGGYLPLGVFLIGGPVLSALLVGLSFLFIEAVGWPRRLLAQRWFFRPPAWARLGWAPGVVALMLAAAVTPASPLVAGATAVLAAFLVLWALILGEPDHRSMRYHWFVSGLMLQAYVAIWWVLVATLPGTPISAQLDIAFAGAVACALLGGGSLVDGWAGEVAARDRLPGLVLLALAGATAELLLLAAHASPRLLPVAAVLLATVIFAAKPVAALLGSGPLAFRHRLMWYAMIGFNVFRAANPEWTPVAGGAWLLTGVGIAIAGTAGPEVEVWLTAWRSGRLAPRRPG